MMKLCCRYNINNKSENRGHERFEIKNPNTKKNIKEIQVHIVLKVYIFR